MNRVYVGNLNPRVSAAELEDFFSTFGDVKSVWLSVEPPTHALIEFDVDRDALHALEKLDGKNGWSVQLHCKSQESGGGGGGDDGPSGLGRGRRSPEVHTPRKKMKNDNGVEPTEFEKKISQELCRCVKMYMSRKRIKDFDIEPTELEMSVGQALFDLEDTIPELKSDLKDFCITGAIKVDVSATCKALDIYYDEDFSHGVGKIKSKLVRQLENKFSGNVVRLIPRGFG